MLPLDLINLICEYLPKYILDDRFKSIYEKFLSTYPVHTKICINKHFAYNPNATEYILENKIEDDEIYASHFVNVDVHKLTRKQWALLSRNPHMVDLLEKNPKKINWVNLSKNPNAVHILERNISNISWSNLLSNKNSSNIWRKYMYKIYWNSFSYCGPIDIIKENLDKVSWFTLSLHRDAIDILKTNIDKIDWSMFSRNANAIKLIDHCPEMYKHKIILEHSDDIQLIKRYKNNQINNVYNAMYVQGFNVNYCLSLNRHAWYLVDKIGFLELLNLIKNPSIFTLTKNNNLINVLSSIF